MNMKKIILIICLTTFLLTITGCNNNNQLNENIKSSQENNPINLNDNIEVTINTASTGSYSCFFYMFTTNFEEVFPNVTINKYENYQSVTYWPGDERDVTEDEISNTELSNNINKLNINNTKETSIINLFKEYQDNDYEAIKDIEYTLDNHRFAYSYTFLTFKNYDYQSDGETFNLKVNELLKDAIKFNGPCGGYDWYEDKILNEELCNEYNLTCDRW